MILTNQFVFIHQPKTGGTFVVSMLAKLYGVDRPGNRLLRSLGLTSGRFIDQNKHGTCNEIPPSHQGKLIVATIRNPYDRYVSQYEFAWWKSTPLPPAINLDQVRQRYPQFPNITFAEYVDFANRFPEGLRLGWHTEQFVRFFFREPGKVLPAINADYIAARRYLADMFPVRFIHTDRLNQELYEFLVSVGHTPEDVQFIREAGKIFPKEGGRTTDQPWQKYYTPELKAKVRTLEGLLFAIFPEFEL